MINYEFDHFFFFINKEDIEIVNKLREIGFVIESSTYHKGQGTKNYCFYFENQYLEIIWIENKDEAINNPSNLFPRSDYLNTNYSPFGIGLRGVFDKKDQDLFWKYEPEYFPGGEIWIGKTDKIKPTLPVPFVLDSVYFGGDEKMIPKNKSYLDKKLFDHTNGSKNIVKLRLSGPNYQEMKTIYSHPKLEFHNAEKHHAEIILDGDFNDLTLNNIVTFKSI